VRAAEAPPLAADELRVYWCPEDPGANESRRQRVDRLLRAVLAPQVGLPKEALAFGREEKGRPFLRHDGAPDFNLSDTHGGTLIALCRRGRIGVDLERSARAPPVQRLARRWFSAQEAELLADLPEVAARLAFIRLWTAKEASCKATGTGIFGYLPRWRFAVEADAADSPDLAPHLLEAPIDAGDVTRWSFLRVAPSAQHTAVLALRDGPGLVLAGHELAG
jgi:4'-phosphopantetheinyl transferase